MEFVKELPSPSIVLDNPGRNWEKVWKRLSSSVLDSETRSYLFLLVHKRVATRERGKRLMPVKYRDNKCQRCEEDEIEDIEHRYTSCLAVADAWIGLKRLIFSVDNCVAMESDDSILNLDYGSSSREEAIIWLLGNFVRTIEEEVVMRQVGMNEEKMLLLLKT